MREFDMDNVTIDGLDETYATNRDVQDVEASTVLVVDFMIDGSSSMWNYETAMRDCLEHYRDAICNSKQAEEMLVSKTIFASSIQTGGYVAPEDFDTSYDADGTTHLYDAIIDRRQRLIKYMEQLDNNGNTPMGCMVILTDGEDVGSTCSISEARQAIEDLRKREITVAFIAFGQEAFGIADSLGIKSKNVKEVSNDESELRHVIDLVSKSAISASKRASTGAGSSDDDDGFFDV